MSRPKNPLPKSLKAVIKTIVAITIALLSIILVARLLARNAERRAGPEGLITDSERIAGYNVEFGEFVDPNRAECQYVDTRIDSPQLDLGYGPLYSVAGSGYQIIIGKTGAVGAIAYGSFTNNEWRLDPSPEGDWSDAYILVLSGCIAPQEWWNRPVLASMLYGVPTTDGRYLSEMMLLIPWPDWVNDEYSLFDQPPAGTAFQAQPWYWNGERYIKTNFVDQQFPIFSTIFSSPTPEAS